MENTSLQHIHLLWVFWHTTTTNTCDYNVSNRDCVPTGLYDFTKGNILDFSFGLESGQIVRFYYAIIGSEDGGNGGMQ